MLRWRASALPQVVIGTITKTVLLSVLVLVQACGTELRSCAVTRRGLRISADSGRCDRTHHAFKLFTDGTLGKVLVTRSLEPAQ